MKLKTKSMTSKWVTIPFGENEEDDPKFKIRPLTNREIGIVRDFIVVDEDTGRMIFKADGKYRVVKLGTEDWANIEVDDEPFPFTKDWEHNFNILTPELIDFLAMKIMYYSQFGEEDEKKLLQRLRSNDPPEISTVTNVSGGDIVMN